MWIPMYTVAVLLKFPDFHVTMMAAELAASTMQKLEACFCPSRRRQYRIGINQRRGVSSSTLRVLILRYNTHLPLNFGWLCNNTIMTIMTSLHTNPNQYPHVSIYIYILNISTQSTTIFLTVWFFKTLGCCHPDMLSSCPKRAALEEGSNWDTAPRAAKRCRSGGAK